jgi:uncharacterized protein (TIGR02452 family)
MQDPRDISRSAAAAMGQEAVLIAHEGHYTAPSGATVPIGWLVERAIEDTTLHLPEIEVPLPPPGPHRTRFSVNNESTLVAAKRFVDDHLDPVALNFASARHPGGGFLNGARAQEESLCRASALYACLVGLPVYHRHDDALYSSWMAYSPGVPVFRDDDGPLLEAPWKCAFITAPAPNARVALQRDRGRGAEIAAVMAERIERVLALAAARGHRSLVLGAWGCGAFGGDAEVVAGLFHDAFRGPFLGVFEAVNFAVLDTSARGERIAPFADRFGG